MKLKSAVPERLYIVYSPLSILTRWTATVCRNAIKFHTIIKWSGIMIMSLSEWNRCLGSKISIHCTPLIVKLKLIFIKFEISGIIRMNDSSKRASISKSTNLFPWNDQNCTVLQISLRTVVVSSVFVLACRCSVLWRFCIIFCYIWFGSNNVATMSRCLCWNIKKTRPSLNSYKLSIFNFIKYYTYVIEFWMSAFNK